MTDPEIPLVPAQPPPDRFPMTWRRWRIGFSLVLLESFFVAGAGASAGANWVAIAAVFCAAAAARIGTYRKEHPIEEIKFDTSFIMRNKTLPLLLLLAGLAGAGCAYVKVYDDQRQAGFKALVPAYPWQDSLGALNRMTISAKTNSMTATVNGLTQSEATTTNAADLLNGAIGAAVKAAVAGATGR